MDLTKITVTDWITIFTKSGVALVILGFILAIVPFIGFILLAGLGGAISAG
jgi:uncharacterized membrane protein YdjX (TVP38/TMEM64 family)